MRVRKEDEDEVFKATNSEVVIKKHLDSTGYEYDKISPKDRSRALKTADRIVDKANKKGK